MVGTYTAGRAAAAAIVDRQGQRLGANLEVMPDSGTGAESRFSEELGLVAVRRGSVVKFMSLNLEDGNLTTNVVVTAGHAGLHVLRHRAGRPDWSEEGQRRIQSAK